MITSLATRLVVLGVLMLSSLVAVAATELTGLTMTNTTPGGVGNVIITFTTDEATFGGSVSGGWYVRTELLTGMVVENPISPTEPCSTSIIDFPAADASATCGASAAGFVFVENFTATPYTLGAGTYTLTISGVRNPSSGTIGLQTLTIFANTGGGTIPPAVSNSAICVECFNITLDATPVPTLPLYALAVLAGLLSLVGLRKRKI